MTTSENNSNITTRLSTDQKILNEMREEILAIPDKEIKRPSVPIAVAFHEADCLVVRANEDLNQLSQIGYDKKRVERLSKINRAARVAVQQNEADDSEIEKLKQQWKETEYPNFKKEKKELTAQCKIAFHNHPRLMDRLKLLMKQRSIPKQLDALYRLGTLAQHNTALLSEYNFPIERYKEAMALSNRLSVLRSKIESFSPTDNEKKMLAVKGLTLLEREVKELRRLGKFLFESDPSHRIHYRSKYLRDRYLSKKEEKRGK